MSAGFPRFVFRYSQPPIVQQAAHTQRHSVVLSADLGPLTMVKLT